MSRLQNAPSLPQLYYLSLVYEHGTAERAAEAAGVSLQTVYKGLKGAHEALGIEVLRPDGRPYVVAERARPFMQWLAPVMRELPGRIEALRHAAAGRVVLATTLPVIMHYGPGFVQEFLARHPGREIVLRDVGTSFGAALTAVRHYEADLALVPGAADAEGLARELVGTCENLLALAAQHPLAGRREIGLGELRAHPMVGYHAQTDLARLVKAIFADHMPEKVVVETGNSEAALAYAQASGSYAVVHEAAVWGRPAGEWCCYRLRQLPPERRPPLAVSLYVRAKVELDPLVAELRAALKERGRALLGQVHEAMQGRYAGDVVEWVG